LNIEQKVAWGECHVGLEARGAWDKYRKALSRQKSALGPPPFRLQPPRVRSDQRALGGTLSPAGLSVVVSARAVPATVAGLTPPHICPRWPLWVRAAARGSGETGFPNANAPLCLPPAEPPGLKISNMRILVALAVFFLVSTQLFAEEIGANDDLNYWSDWSDSDQIKEELPEPFEHILQRIARRPKPQQFFGLMGKRDAGHGQISHKRHKTDSFVGLMGKRALNSVAYERSAMQNYERRRK
uniref:Protachykinin-1 n=2 Tax=Callithrix jacchus TaxID=9483 RepID=A0A5F4W2F9_CALJA